MAETDVLCRVTGPNRNASQTYDTVTVTLLFRTFTVFVAASTYGVYACWLSCQETAYDILVVSMLMAHGRMPLVYTSAGTVAGCLFSVDQSYPWTDAHRDPSRASWATWW